MYQRKRNIGIRVLLLAVFFSYFTDITFFTHSHIVDGVTIVHSHFFSGSGKSENNKNTPVHSHPYTALILITQAATWTATLYQALEIPNSPLTGIITYRKTQIPESPLSAVSVFYLRGPPVRI